VSRADGFSGWSAQGSRSFVPRANVFWDVVVGAVVSVTKRRMNQVEAIGDSILSLGVLGAACTESGMGQRLLLTCLQLFPERFIETMAPVLHETGVFPKANRRNQGEAVFFTTKGQFAFSTGRIAQVIRGKSDSRTWVGADKGRAHVWVSSVALLLRDEQMDRAQSEFAAAVLPSFLSGITEKAIRWSSATAGDTWQHTKEQQALWAFALVLSMWDHQVTTALFDKIDEESAAGPVPLLREVQRRLTAGSVAALPVQFVERAVAVLCFLETTLGVQIGDP
jgi:hypothetical protein